MKLMTCREASEALREQYGITQGQIKRGCEANKYPYLKIGNRLMVDVDKLREILDGEQKRQQLQSLKHQKQKHLLSTADLALRIGLSESSIRRAVADGWLPCQVVGRNMRFDLLDVQRAIAERMNGKYNI